MKGYVLVEGQGEVAAVPNLLARLCAQASLPLYWDRPLRWKALQHWKTARGRGVKQGAEFIRTKADADALLILCDADECCPRELAPEMARRLRELNLPFPTAYVLFKPEYEVLFLTCLDQMVAAGYPGELQWPGPSWETKRDVKGWLSDQLPKGRIYKETIDQLKLTQLLDFDQVRDAQVPCFGSLERALRFLADHQSQSAAVYPIAQ